MAKHKKMGVLFIIQFQTIMGALIGLILGILYSFGGLIIDTLVTLGLITSSETPGLSYGTVLAFGALVGMPIIFALFGCVLGLIEAVLYKAFYKLFTKCFGKINIDIEK
jgi:hypothetical protein